LTESSPHLPGWRRWFRLSLKRQVLMPIAALWVASFFIATGAAYWLAGRSTSDAFDRLLADEGHHASFARRINPYGDGQASQRIVRALLGQPFDEFAAGHTGAAAVPGITAAVTKGMAPA